MSQAPHAPADIIKAAEPARRRQDAQTLLPFFQKVTGYAPVLWSGSIIGYGRYDYRYDSGREGTSFATGFSPRKAAMSIYIMPGYRDYDHILARLGPHKMGKACLYVTRLDRIDMAVLQELIETGLRNLGQRYAVSAT